MLAVRSTESGVRAVTVDAPSGPGLQVDIAAAGICGTDVSFAAMGLRDFTYGHEMAGTTPDGRAWAVEPLLYCGACPQCLSGDVQRCDGEGHGVLGIFQNGGMTSQLVVPQFTLLPLPAGLPVQDACLVEPGSVAWHGVRRAGLVLGDTSPSSAADPSGCWPPRPLAGWGSRSTCRRGTSTRRAPQSNWALDARTDSTT
jgi:threonine dehydrogenase-like Zn-dependent dehydrogenase